MMDQLILESVSRRTNKKIIRHSQHEFTKGKSCLTDPITFRYEMPGLVDEGRAVDIVYVAFQNALTLP